MKKVLLILHQKRSVAGDVGIKLKKRGYELEFCRPPLGDTLPNELNLFSLIVIFGGPMSANDEDDFIKKEINFMKLIIESDVPYLGICLGAQFLAKYLGSSVEKNNLNLCEIGFYKISPSKDGEEIFKKQKIFYHFHTEGFDLPSCCKVLAYGDRFKYQAFQYKKLLCFPISSRSKFYNAFTLVVLCSIKQTYDFV